MRFFNMADLELNVANTKLTSSQKNAIFIIFPKEANLAPGRFEFQTFFAERYCNKTLLKIFCEVLRKYTSFQPY